MNNQRNPPSRLIAASILCIVSCVSAVEVSDGESSGQGTSSGSEPAANSGTATAPATTTGTTPATGTTTGTSSSESSGVPELPTGGCGFLGCNETGSKNYECSIWDQNCPAGEKCAPAANEGGNGWNATRCVPIAARPDAVGEACTQTDGQTSGIDSCEQGSICWTAYSDPGTGTCVAHCTGSEDAPTCADPQSVCSIGAAGVLTLCIATCDPLDPATCNDGESCYLADIFVCAPDGGENGPGVQEPCEFLNDCASGLVCIGGQAVPDCETGECCTSWCDLSAPDCPEPTTCLPAFYEGQIPIGAEDLGICALPE